MKLQHKEIETSIPGLVECTYVDDQSGTPKDSGKGSKHKDSSLDCTQSVRFLGALSDFVGTLEPFGIAHGEEGNQTKQKHSNREVEDQLRRMSTNKDDKSDSHYPFHSCLCIYLRLSGKTR